MYLIYYTGDGGVPASITVSYCDVQGGQVGVYVEPGSTLNWGSGNIDTDPLFVDAPNYDLHLQETSPCIDTGTAEDAPSDDLDGNFRPVGSGYDMGAYEYQGPIVIDSFSASSLLQHHPN